MSLARIAALVGSILAFAVVSLAGVAAAQTPTPDAECYPIPPGGCPTTTPTPTPPAPTCEDILADPNASDADVTRCCEELQDRQAAGENVTLPAACVGVGGGGGGGQTGGGGAGAGGGGQLADTGIGAQGLAALAGGLLLGGGLLVLRGRRRGSAS